MSFLEGLVRASDYARVVLAVEGILLVIIPLAAAYVLVTALGRFLPKLRQWLRTGRLWVELAGEGVSTAMGWVLAPILLVSGWWAGLRRAAEVLRRRQMRYGQ